LWGKKDSIISSYKGQDQPWIPIIFGELVTGLHDLVYKSHQFRCIVGQIYFNICHFLQGNDKYEDHDGMVDIIDEEAMIMMAMMMPKMRMTIRMTTMRMI
jgi:hypothetical protein